MPRKEIVSDIKMEWLYVTDLECSFCAVSLSHDDLLAFLLMFLLLTLMTTIIFVCILETHMENYVESMKKSYFPLGTTGESE